MISKWQKYHEESGQKVRKKLNVQTLDSKVLKRTNYGRSCQVKWCVENDNKAQVLIPGSSSPAAHMVTMFVTLWWWWWWWWLWWWSWWWSLWWWVRRAIQWNPFWTEAHSSESLYQACFCQVLLKHLQNLMDSCSLSRQRAIHSRPHSRSSSSSIYPFWDSLIGARADYSHTCPPPLLLLTRCNFKDISRASLCSGFCFRDQSFFKVQ